MSYPVISSGALAPNAVLTVRFRPALAGWVNVNVTGGAPLPPLRLDVMKPGSTAAAVSRTSAQMPAGAQALFVDVAASTTELAADWTATVTNTGTAPATVTATVRYPTTPGPLGEIDHVVVLMMENRSFDHMLGFLSLAGNSAVDGLKGNESNQDVAGTPIPVHHLGTTTIGHDPGHGWTDVDEQLSKDASGRPNAGFVKNYIRQLTSPTTLDRPMVLAGGTSSSVAFRLGFPCTITVTAFAANIPSNLHSASGQLGTIVLFRPGQTTAAAQSSTPLGSALLKLTYDATPADVASGGMWTCTVTNASDATVAFDTTVSYVASLAASQSGQLTIAAEDTATLTFAPTAVGPLTIVVTPVHGGTTLRSELNLLARIELRRPGVAKPIATQNAPLHATELVINHTVTAADLAAPGNWTCAVSNETLSSVTFSTRVSFSTAIPAADIMGYYNANDVWQYAFLAKNFLLFNRWFASLPTDTWPNRLYSLTGGSGGLTTTPSGSDVTSNPPGYTLTTIFEVLQAHGVDWNIFFGNIPFALIFRHLAQDASYTSRMRPFAELVSRAAVGALPKVSWIDPSFSDAKYDALPNDDHPPIDVEPGQRLVHDIYAALASGPAWSKTLLVCVYDEHGGLYDHVTPPGSPTAPGGPPTPGGPADDQPTLQRYGVRIPAFAVSAWVPPGSVTNGTYDHTSLLATILRRFCKAADGSVPSMGKRTDAAADLGSLLTLTAPRTPPPPAPSAPATATAAVAATAASPTSFGTVLHKSLFGF